MTKKKSASVQPLLVAVDFSPHSKEALRWAAEMAQCVDAPVIVLHVVHDPESSPGYYMKVKKAKKLLRRFEDAAEEMMAEFVADARKTSPAVAELKKLETMTVIGLPVTRILEVAKKRNARLIVVGSQGRTGLPHFLLGSKALKVAQLSPVPVTIVKNGSKSRKKEPAEVRKGESR